jgi:hypothetical protein
MRENIATNAVKQPPEEVRFRIATLLVFEARFLLENSLLAATATPAIALAHRITRDR